MTYDVTEQDKYLIRQHVLDLRVKIEVWDFDGNRIDIIEGGVTQSSFNCDAESDIRRTFSLTVIPNVQQDVNIGEDSLVWLDRKLCVYIGILDQRTKEYQWFPQGWYVFTSASLNYDATTNEMSLSCSDLMAMLDGSRCGNLGYLKYVCPAYEENDETGVVKHYYTIRETLLTVVKQLAWQWFDDCDIDDIGERKGMPNYSVMYSETQPEGDFWIKDTSEENKWVWDYLAYRESTINPVYPSGEIDPEDEELETTWDKVPSDQEFESGTTVLNVVTTLRDLYEQYETFIDIYGTFCAHLIPSGDEDPIVFDNNFFQQILISENTDIDFTAVKNVAEIWGKTYEEDFYTYKDEDFTWTTETEDETERFSLCSANVDKYGLNDNNSDDGYINGDVIALKMAYPNIYGAQIVIPGEYTYDNPYTKQEETREREPVYIYDENSEEYLTKDTIRAGGTYCFQVKKKYDTEAKKSVTKLYYMGEWEPHAMAVLTDGTVGEETQVTYYDALTETSQTFTVNKYSKEFFEKVYNCNTVQLTVNEDSPFTIQKIGIIPYVKSDDNITSDPTALETALQENYRNCRLTDSITITTKICPFADVNIKVTYRPHDSEESYEYLVKSISHDVAGGTTTWTLMRYYRLYLTTFTNPIYG